MLMGIVGPCGSGKTTLAKMLAGRVKPSSGEIRINGKVVGTTDQELPVSVNKNSPLMRALAV